MQQIYKSVIIALQNIRSNPLYTFLSTLGVIIGVASLVAILALGDGLEETGRKQIENTTSVQIISVSPKKYDFINEVRVPRDSKFTFTIPHARDIESEIKEWGFAELTAQSSRKVSYRDSSLGVYIQATLENAVRFRDLEIEGAYFTSEHIERKSFSTVLTKALAKSWSPNPELLIGDSIKIEGNFYEVIGIIDTGEKDLQAFIPFSTYQQYINNPNEPSLLLKSIEVENVPKIKKIVEEWFNDNIEEGKEAVSISTYQARVEQLTQGILIFKLVMGAITGISVLVGGIGVMNVLLISVKERTREIGIRKATGAKKKDIVLQFLSESVTISMVGSLAGWVVGILGVFGLVEVINHLTDFNFNAALQPGAILLIVIIAIFVGVVFGTYPAWKAANLTPVDAIRHE
jgi:putative ABC transport system permease protein